MLDHALSIDISHGQSYTRQMRAVVVSLWRHIVQMKANLYTNPVTPILTRHVAVITQRDMTFYLNPNILVFVFQELRIVRVIWRRVLNRILLIREVCNYIINLICVWKQLCKTYNWKKRPGKIICWFCSVVSLLLQDFSFV